MDMDLNREFERTARLSFEYESGPRLQLQRERPPYNDTTGFDNSRFGDRTETRSPYEQQQQIIGRSHDRFGRRHSFAISGQGLGSGQQDNEVDEDGQPFEIYESAVALPYSQQQQQRSLGPNNFGSIFEMAAELVAKKLEGKLSLPQTVPPQFQILYPVGGSGAGGFTSVAATASPPTELITGVVTKVQDTFGMISGDVFFLYSTVSGELPKLGDKVVVEAFPVEGMPFKFNAKRVQLVSQDFTSPSKSSSKKSKGKSKQNVDNTFGPLPKMPSSLNLLDGRSSSKKRHSSPKERKVGHKSAPPPPQLSTTPYRAGGILSFDLRDEIPTIKQGFGRVPQRQIQRSPSPTGRNRSISRSPKPRISKRSSRSRGRSSDRKRRSRSKSPVSRGVRIRRSRSRSPSRRKVRSPPRSSKTSHRGEDTPPVLSHSFLAEPAPSQDNGGRKRQRPPRSIASIIRYHIATPPPEEERFVPNPCARNPIPNPTPQNKADSGGPAVMYLHNPNFDPRGHTDESADLGLINKVARPSQQDIILQQLALQQQQFRDQLLQQQLQQQNPSQVPNNGPSSTARALDIDRFLNQRKLCEIEDQRKQLAAQKKALESEMKKNKHEKNISKYSTGSGSSKRIERKHEIPRREEELSRHKRGSEGTVKRLEVNELHSRSVVATKKTVEWITPGELRQTGGRGDVDEGRVRRSREDDGGGGGSGRGQLHWELPSSQSQSEQRRAKITRVERQEEQLSEREQAVLDRMWAIQSQRDGRN